MKVTDMQIVYPAIFLTRESGGYSVLFPDLPGCISAGETIHDAFLQAAEGLTLHLDGMAQEGLPFPAPTSLEGARHAAIHEYEAAPADIAAVQLVAATPPGRTIRLNMTMDANLVAQIDAVTENRSAFLSDAARAELARRRTAA